MQHTTNKHVALYYNVELAWYLHLILKPVLGEVASRWQVQVQRELTCLIADVHGAALQGMGSRTAEICWRIIMQRWR